VSENQPITTVLRKDNFTEPDLAKSDRRERKYICSSVRLTSLPPRQWSEEFAEAVKKAGKKDYEYQGAVKELEAVLRNVELNDQKVEEEATRPREAQQRDRKVRTEEVLDIKEGLLYQKGMLWIPEDGNLKNLILGSEHDMSQTETHDSPLRHGKNSCGYLASAQACRCPSTPKPTG